jgi:hypothetical protein
MRRHAFTSGVLAALLCVGLAQAEMIQQGDLRLAYSAKFAPKALPRERPAPVTVTLGGSIATVNGSRPPELRRVSVAVNRFGQVSTRGLPTCEKGELEQTSTELALARCREALVGRGGYAAMIDVLNLPDPIPVEGDMLAFYSRNRGRPAILLHAFTETPVSVAVVVTFNINRPKEGDFGTVFTARIPKIAADLGYVTAGYLRLARRYRYAGEPHSFVNARCAAPLGFSGGPFAFTRGTFSFANGQRLSVTLTRNCRVR